MLLNCSVEEDSWEFLGLQEDQTSQSYRKLILNIHYRDWSWNSNTLATWWEELTHWEKPWCWERLKAGVEGDDRGWDGWMASLTQWTWVWASSKSWWWTGKPGVLKSMGSQRVGHNRATEQNWTELPWGEIGVRERRGQKCTARTPCSMWNVSVTERVTIHCEEFFHLLK